MDDELRREIKRLRHMTPIQLRQKCVEVFGEASRSGIYTRKSTEEGLEQEFNTLRAQREAAENYIASQRERGWVTLPEPYDDGGFTGGNMERPALRRLMQDIEAGKVADDMPLTLEGRMHHLLAPNGVQQMVSDPPWWGCAEGGRRTKWGVASPDELVLSLATYRAASFP